MKKRPWHGFMGPMRKYIETLGFAKLVYRVFHSKPMVRTSTVLQAVFHNDPGRILKMFWGRSSLRVTHGKKPAPFKPMAPLVKHKQPWMGQYLGADDLELGRAVSTLEGTPTEDDLKQLHAIWLKRPM